jgi:flagellar biosynthesis protein FlhG
VNQAGAVILDAGTALRAAPTREPRGGDQASRLRELVRAMSTGNAAAAPKPMRLCPVLAITSGKGGVGKTTLAVNLSIALSQRGVRVTLLDADLGMANADVMCGLNPARRLEMAMAMDGSRRTLTELSVEAPGGFRLIPGSVGIAKVAALTPSQRADVLEQLAQVGATSDLIVIDTGAGLSPGVLGFAQAADMTLIAVTPEPTSIADAYAMAKCLRLGSDGEGPRLAMVVNQAKDAAEAQAVHARIDAVATRFLKEGVRLAGYVRSDDAVARAVRARKPMMLGAVESPAVLDVRTLSEFVAAQFSLRVSLLRAPRRRFLRLWWR